MFRSHVFVPVRRRCNLFSKYRFFRYSPVLTRTFSRIHFHFSDAQSTAGHSFPARWRICIRRSALPIGCTLLASYNSSSSNTADDSPDRQRISTRRCAPIFVSLSALDVRISPHRPSALHLSKTNDKLYRGRIFHYRPRLRTRKCKNKAQWQMVRTCDTCIVEDFCRMCPFEPSLGHRTCSQWFFIVSSLLLCSAQPFSILGFHVRIKNVMIRQPTTRIFPLQISPQGRYWCTCSIPLSV
ncbi:hypothetical protein C8R43DRAFT_1048646, partial [Mycena crocata]